ncbi:hypothetical protein FHW92_001632 [Novosphingobium sp. SG707]|nr:hypothetical protein [Novosphingobium sp. SG707]
MAEMSGDLHHRIDEAINRLECLGSMAYGLSLNPDLAPYMADGLRGIWMMLEDTRGLLAIQPVHGVAA